jgi:superfamily II DNA or RNA helicase
MKKPNATGFHLKSTDNFKLLDGAVRHCSGWDDFRRNFAGLPDKQKGDLFEQLVKAYLLLDPEYATKLAEVWIHYEVPEAIRAKLNLPDADQGIDLIARTREGEFWAIQCKYRDDATHPLPWRELSTFTGLAFGVCRNIAFGLICSTTERVTHVLKTQDHIGFCALDVWQGLDAEFFARLRAMLGRRPARIKPLKPRPHQLAAIRDAQSHFVTKKAQRGKLIMPCGSGKSLAAYWITQKLGAKRILIAVPSLALIRQTLKVWLRESMANGQAVEWICVCSDESAGRIGRDDVAVLRQDLGVPCLTDANDIAKWLAKTNHGLTVVFTTYQSGAAIAKAARQAKVRFDLGIMDEAHKTVGAKDKLFSHLLYDKNLTIRRRIFMTATERRYQGQGDQILSMDDLDIYGETFHLLSFKKALEYKPPILSDYKIVTILVSRDEVAELIRKNVFLRPDKGPWDKEIEAEMLAALVALRKAMQKYPIRHAVSFHSSIRRAELFRAHNDAFTRAYPDYGNVTTFHVSGQTPTGTRARMVKEFAETGRGLITNARCLTEGVDVPGIDCVMFADPRKSAVDIVQAVGRALRPAAGKKLGYVIVPILHDAKARTEEILESEDFKEVLTTLRALAANDDRIIEYFQAVSEGRRHTGGGSVEFDMDERLAQRIDLAQFAQDIELKCWDRLAKLSWRPFEEARAFAHKLKLKNQNEWFDFAQGHMPHLEQLPADIPSNPNNAYADKGWKGYGDWLGTGNIANFLKEYRSFREARTFTRKLKLKNFKQWIAFRQGRMPQLGRLPKDIPANPNRTYADNGWKTWGDWLGSGNISNFLKEYRSFPKARAFARKLKLNSGNEWQAFCKGKMPHKGRLPEDIPAAPHQTYADNGWKGYGDWLGTGNIAAQLKKYRPFREARAFARRLKLENFKQWVAFMQGRMPQLGQRPVDIPVAADHTYADKGWKNWGDWLGTGNIATSQKEYRSFLEARAFARKLKLKSQSEWITFTQGRIPRLGKLPDDIPACPNQTYANKGWIGYGDWLGTGNIASFLKKYRPFSDARIFARKLKLKNFKQWVAFTQGHIPQLGRLPDDIPAYPGRTYADKGWTGYGDWLGTGNIANFLKEYRPFYEARAFARKLKLKNYEQWVAFRQGLMPKLGHLPKDIPATPSKTYAAKGWKSWGDWLGTERTRRTKH